MSAVISRLVHHASFGVAALAALFAGCGARSELDAGTPTDAAPAAPSGRTVSMSWSHACAIVDGGSVACWGALTPEGRPTPTPVLVAGVADVVEVAAGQLIDCARRADGVALCWGMATGGAPVPVDGATFSSIVAGSAAVCGITDGGVACAGSPFLAAGACNQGGVSWSATAVAVRSQAKVAGLSMGQWHACAFDTSGRTSCWGCGDEGPPGEPWVLGSRSASTASAVPVPGVTATTRIAGETDTSCAVQADGATLCWGDESQFGSTVTFAPIGPTTAGFSLAPVDLDVGVTFSCAAYPDHIECLGGIPTFADACHGTATSLSLPFADTREISVGYENACVRDGAGQVWCWGCNANGEVGDGTMTAAPSPVRVL